MFKKIMFKKIIQVSILSCLCSVAFAQADKKAAIEQLTDRHKFLDINRVGIHGHSGGGFMSTAAMLTATNGSSVATNALRR